MSQQIRRYISEHENFEFNRGLNQPQQAASTLRQKFLKKFIVNFDTNLYKTQEQRDWAYIAKRYKQFKNIHRQYNYDVVLTGLGFSMMVSNVVLSWRIFVKKNMVFWPLAIIPAAYFIISPTLLQKHSKKLFDMCNLGEEFYLGRRRNQVLIECNQILGVEDF